jgi:subtilisin family serine protease/subtilisin-like proprotein convertase family protein
MTAPFRGTSRARLRVERLEDRSTPTAAADGPDFDPGRVLVTFADPAADADHLAALGRSPLAAGVRRVGDGVYRVDLATGATVGSAAADLGQLPGVLAAEPDYQVQVERMPNDPGASGQWGLTKVGAPAAWQQSTGTGAVIVAVVDTGVDYAHPDLAPNMWRNPGEIPGDGIDNDHDGIVDDVYGANFITNTGNPMDDVGHGTHVAGIVGARGDNGLGVTGVAWTTRIMALKFMGPNGGYTSDAVRAIDYAVAHGAKVINASWGGVSSDPALTAAVARARAAGVVVVTAAGNNAADLDRSPFYPAGLAPQLDNLVAVAATDQADRLAGFSDFGRSTVALAAPGVGVLSTLPGGRYGSMSGTSMAAPFVSGAVAEFWGVHPDWSYQMVLARLRASATLPSSLAGKVAAGRLDLGRMLSVSPPPAPPVVPPPPPAAAPDRRWYPAPAMPRPIQDRRTTRIDLVVNDDFRVADVAVQLRVTHGRTSDLSIRLVAPDGRAVTLFNRRGPGANLAATFDDRSAAGLASAAAPFPGTYRPEQPLGLFRGMNARGVWSVQVFDLADGATGSVDGVLLSFGVQAAAPRTQAAGSDLLPLMAADLRGADDAARTAVPAGLATGVQARVGRAWFGEVPAAAANYTLSIPVARRQGLPLAPATAAPPRPADPWADLADEFSPIRV